MIISQAKNLICEQITTHTSQTFIIEGSYKVGQKKLASDIISFYNKSKGADVVWINKSPDKSTIGLAEIETLKNNIKQSPLYGKYSFSIIDNADFLTKESQNSLLKIIEEPSQHSIIILLGTYHNLLSTIYSRCLSIYLNPSEALDLSLGHDDLQLDLKANPNLYRDLEYLWALYLELLTNKEIAIFNYVDLISKYDIELVLFVWESIHWILSLAHTDKEMYTRIRLQQNFQQLLEELHKKTTASWNYKLLSKIQDLKTTMLFSNRKKSLAIEQFLLSNHPNL
ncbi:MAG: hypothetical protein RLZZ223_277 [Candidatus Parcubacteria bacterium]|jgi:hypothetical protein